VTPAALIKPQKYLGERPTLCLARAAKGNLPIGVWLTTNSGRPARQVGPPAFLAVFNHKAVNRGCALTKAKTEEASAVCQGQV
jgi:hypothetical protein